MSKLRIYIRQVLQLAMGSKLRFALSVMGMEIGIVLFSMGNFILDSYYYGSFKEIRSMPNDSFYIEFNNDSKSLRDDLLFWNNYQPVQERISQVTHIIYMDEMENGSMMIVNGRLQELNRQTNRALTYGDAYGVNMTALNITKGRMFTNEEIQQHAAVCVIDEFTAELLFGKDEAIGKSIEFGKYSDGEDDYMDSESAEQQENSLEVVGVIENNYYTDKKEKKYSENTNSDNVETYESVNLFCPYGYAERLNEEGTEDNTYLLWQESNNTKRQVMENDITEYVDNNFSNPLLHVTSRKSLRNQLQLQLQPIRYGIIVVTICLLLISGIASMTNIFFAMKERVGEIGIKKAFGAGCIDIIIQFLLENLLTCTIAIILAIMLSLFACYYSESFIQVNYFDDYEVHITMYNLIAPIVLGFLQSIVFTIIPSVRYALMPVTNALRCED